MLRQSRLIALTAVLAGTIAARADLTPTSVSNSPQCVTPSAERIVHDQATDEFASDPSAEVSDELLSGLSQWAGEGLLGQAVSDAAANVSNKNAIVLPPGPSSATLFLSALAGFGCYQLGRSVRKVNFGFVPEWYHTGGPDQIGHSTPLDLDFSHAALPLCRLDQPVSLPARLLLPNWWRLAEPAYQLSSQCFLLNADPRGPPSVSH